MTQYQFETIIKIVASGAPALADELNNSLNDLVVERNALAAENEELKNEIKKIQSCECENSCDCNEPKEG